MTNRVYAYANQLQIVDTLIDTTLSLNGNYCTTNGCCKFPLYVSKEETRNNTQCLIPDIRLVLSGRMKHIRELKLQVDDEIVINSIRKYIGGLRSSNIEKVNVIIRGEIVSVYDSTEVE